MTRDEALMHLTVAYGHHPAVADFNIAAVNHVLDLLVAAKCEEIASKIEQMPFGDTASSFAAYVRGFK